MKISQSNYYVAIISGKFYCSTIFSDSYGFLIKLGLVYYRLKFKSSSFTDMDIFGDWLRLRIGGGSTSGSESVALDRPESCYKKYLFHYFELFRLNAIHNV